ncbi:hypothetical protein BDV36DRAFT_244527 [Aspergillus pseudocaelatus]|uniref:Uncharacterized protein n=1 Tax=Aspergillus pseudocaelatus TaxID=1825620 RepID=A0ABQ6X3M7_9EURO|nr:hypothetical protein BDV36DRAFT_244527 [Aspergillus pseudocaelatus]
MRALFIILSLGYTVSRHAWVDASQGWISGSQIRPSKGDDKTGPSLSQSDPGSLYSRMGVKDEARTNSCPS